MSIAKKAKKNSIDQLLNGLWTTNGEWAKLRSMEKQGKTEAYARALVELDKKQSLRELKDIKGLDERTVNKSTMQATPLPADMADRRFFESPTALTPLTQLLEEGKAACECIVPLVFSGFRTFGALSGPNTDDVRAGILGACRLAGGEYSLSNHDNSDGTWRAPLGGSMILSFSAAIPASGSYYLLAHPGIFWIRGCSRVVGHGNSTTCYDAKIWVNHFTVIDVNGTIMEISGGQIHHDGTRSSDRTKNFQNDLLIQSRYFPLYARRNDTVTLSYRLLVNSEANQDGIAAATIDYFGFLANSNKDLNSILVRSS